MDLLTAPGRIWAENEEGQVIAEVIFPAENGVASITRTFVDGSLRGQGTAGKLLKAAVAAIRGEGMKAIPVCSYAVRWFEEHPEAADLLHR